MTEGCPFLLSPSLSLEGSQEAAAWKDQENEDSGRKEQTPYHSVPEDSPGRLGLLGCSVVCETEQVATAVRWRMSNPVEQPSRFQVLFCNVS